MIRMKHLKSATLVLLLALLSRVHGQSLIQDSKGETAIIFPYSQVNLNFGASEISGRYYYSWTSQNNCELIIGGGLHFTATEGKTILYKDSEFQFFGGASLNPAIRIPFPNNDDVYFYYNLDWNRKKINLWDSTTVSIEEKSYDISLHNIGITYSPSWANIWIGFAYQFGVQDNASELTEANFYANSLTGSGSLLAIDPKNAIGPIDSFNSDVDNRKILVDATYVCQRVGFTVQYRRNDINVAGKSATSNLGLGIFFNKNAASGIDFIGGFVVEFSDLAKEASDDPLGDRTKVSVVVGYPFN